MLTDSEATQLKADIGSLIDALTEGAPPPPPANPVITSFVYDANGNLVWTSENGVSATLDDGTGPVSVALSGSQAVLPPQTTTYTLRVVGETGTTDAVAQVTVTVTPLPVGDTIGPGLVEFEEIHVHAGQTLTILPGTELVRLDVPPADPAHGDGGIVNHGTLIAVRGPTDAPILIRSQNPSGIRGHLMSHGVMQLRGVEIRDFGRTTNALLSATNPIARYACHWHLAGDQPTSFVEDCVIHDTAPKSTHRFGIVLHGTSGVTVRNNTIRNKCGSGIYLEDGTETNNVIEGNVIEDIWSHNLSDWKVFPARHSTVESGMAGNGIYAKNPWNRFLNNTVRRAPNGYVIYPRFSSPPGWVPAHILEFAGNVAEQCNKGLDYAHIGGLDRDSVFESFTARGCLFGVYPYEGWRIVLANPVFDGCTIVGHAGIDYLQHNCKIVNPTAINCPVGIGAAANVEGEFLIEGGLLRCVVNIEVSTCYTASAYATNIKNRKTVIRGVKHEAMPGKPLKAIVATVRTSGTRSLTIKDEIWVYDHNGVVGDDFRVYWNPQQTAEYILPASNLPGLIASPGPGPMTNADALAQYGKCFHGEIAPADATTWDGIVGLVKPL